MALQTTTGTIPFWRRSVFSAEWRNLCLFNYAVEPERLRPYVPEGLSLDVRDGRAFVSLVALEHSRPRMLGLGLPGRRAFAQVNLRFYVHDGERPGVSFVGEHAPPWLIALGSRALFGEPLRRAPVAGRVEVAPTGEVEAEYTLVHAGRTNRLFMRMACQAEVPALGTEGRFFSLRPFAYSRAPLGRTLSYDVTHPVWATHAVTSYELDWDFGGLYGAEWSDLGESVPHSTMFAEGSRVHASLPAPFA